MAFEIAKAGWLHRQSSVLRRWKRNWFVLYTSGLLKYFESPDNYVAKEAELIPAKLHHMKIGKEVSGVTPPPGFTNDCLIMLVFGDNNWTLCAESVDDMRAWQLALEEARLLRAATSDAPPPYSAAATQPVYAGQPYPQQMYVGPTGQTTYTYYGNHPPPYVMQSPPGQTTVIYTDGPGPYYYRRGYDGTDVAMGVVAGAALGSMMWGPLLWW